VAVYTPRVDLRSALRRLLGGSSDDSESLPPDVRDELGETKTIEETLDDVKEDQATETGRGLP